MDNDNVSKNNIVVVDGGGTNDGGYVWLGGGVSKIGVV